MSAFVVAQYVASRPAGYAVESTYGSESLITDESGTTITTESGENLEQD